MVSLLFSSSLPQRSCGRNYHLFIFVILLSNFDQAALKAYEKDLNIEPSKSKSESSSKPLKTQTKETCSKGESTGGNDILLAKRLLAPAANNDLISTSTCASVVSVMILIVSIIITMIIITMITTTTTTTTTTIIIIIIIVIVIIIIIIIIISKFLAQDNDFPAF